MFMKCSLSKLTTLLLISQIFACNSSEIPTSAPKSSEDLPSDQEDHTQDENDTQAIPELDLEWSSSEKSTRQPESSGPTAAMPNFSRTDVNPYSNSYNSEISPQGYLGSVTGWYFIKAT